MACTPSFTRRSRWTLIAFTLSARIPQMDWAGRTEGRGNAGQTADSFFHPSGPSGFSHLIPPKSLIKLSKLTRGAGRTPFHPGNPGLDQRLSFLAITLRIR